MTRTTYHPDDAPDFEQEITGERTTCRITVDDVAGSPYGVLAMETNDPAGGGDALPRSADCAGDDPTGGTDRLRGRL